MLTGKSINFVTKEFNFHIISRSFTATYSVNLLQRSCVYKIFPKPTEIYIVNKRIEQLKFNLFVFNIFISMSLFLVFFWMITFTIECCTRVDVWQKWINQKRKNEWWMNRRDFSTKMNAFVTIKTEFEFEKRDVTFRRRR